jgi:c-di-GMP-related signal transduction protein
VIDVRGKSVEALATEYARAAGAPVLATNVTTRAQLLIVHDLGFDLFHGLFVQIAAIARRKRNDRFGERAASVAST